MRKRTAAVEDLVAVLAVNGGISRPTELADRLGISQPTFSRLVRAAGPALAAIGKGKATRYALTREIRDCGPRLPIYRIAEDGTVQRHGELTALHGGRTLLRYADGTQALHEGLPWFIDDMRPQGFLGRLFAQQAAAIGVPADPREWSADDTLRALSRLGDDGVGNLILGDTALARHLERPVAPVDRADYPALALAMLAGAAPGSSAGGEQPKFACARLDPQGGLRHVIVKFSPPADSGPAARRWADLLVCEHLALQTLAAAGWPAAPSELIEAGGRTLLEVERFDRTAAGRIGIVSGAAIEAEFVGGATTWTKLGSLLTAAGRLSPENDAHLAGLEIFGGMIGNSDMHLGNISFYTEHRFTLAPCYDMLPMRYAPVGRGELLPETHAPAIPAFSWDNRRQWRAAAELARHFWTQVQGDPRLDGRLAAIATASRAAIDQACTACARLEA